MIDSYTIIIVVGVFIMAGTVKGIIGLGLSTISLALLTAAIDLPSAIVHNASTFSKLQILGKQSFFFLVIKYPC